MIELDSSLSMHKKRKEFELKLLKLSQDGIVGVWKLTDDRIKGKEKEVILSPELLRYHFDRLDGGSHIQYFIDNICYHFSVYFYFPTAELVVSCFF